MVPLKFDTEYDLKELLEIIRLIRERSPNSFKQARMEFIEELKAKHSIEDIEISLLVLDCIRCIDQMVFGKKTISEAMIIKKSRDVAFYFPKNDTYGVCIRSIKSYLERKSIVYNFEDGADQEVIEVSFEAAILAIALHEVRHRLQKHKMVKIFTKKTMTRNERINRFILFERMIFKRQKKMVFKKTRSRKYASERNKDIEFDSSLIEDIFLAEIAKKGKFSFEMIKRFLFTDPIRLFT